VLCWFCCRGKVKDDPKEALVALKMIRMDNEKEGFPITAIREIKLLSTLKHENIVNLREIVRSKGEHSCDVHPALGSSVHWSQGWMFGDTLYGLCQRLYGVAACWGSACDGARPGLAWPCVALLSQQQL
jgi:hypothetical protein